MSVDAILVFYSCFFLALWWFVCWVFGKVFKEIQSLDEKRRAVAQWRYELLKAAVKEACASEPETLERIETRIREIEHLPIHV